jgi:hypothetical protein
MFDSPQERHYNSPIALDTQNSCKKRETFSHEVEPQWPWIGPLFVNQRGEGSFTSWACTSLFMGIQVNTHYF